MDPEDQIPNELLDQLKDFGFTNYEAKAYITLVDQGILSAPEIAKKSGLPKSRIYDTLKMLQTKRMIEEFPGTPRKFKARNPSFVIDDLVQKKEKHFKNQKSNAINLKTRLNTMINNTEKTYLSNESILWTVNGRRGFHEKFAEMGARATEEVKVITPYFSRNTILEKSINSARSRNVKFTGITTLNDENRDRVRYYIEYFNSIYRFAGDIPLTLIIIDDKECMYRMNYQTNGQLNYVGVHSTNTGLIKAFTQYWDGLMKDSTIINSF
ncbi:MAG: hypothetical protein KAI18_01220 [Candidatus Aenigmarchaeota archaeon]|nr:hypothetical protein [Candidatus Aenigmarchaeota archaeon]